MTEVIHGPLVGELIDGALAKELGELAETIAKSGYVPVARRAEHDALVKSADTVGDRELAKYYRQKAAAIRKQLGETV